jgi:hypothetical protein
MQHDMAQARLHSSLTRYRLASRRRSPPEAGPGAGPLVAGQAGGSSLRAAGQVAASQNELGHLLQVPGRLAVLLSQGKGHKTSVQ